MFRVDAVGAMPVEAALGPVLEVGLVHLPFVVLDDEFERPDVDLVAGVQRDLDPRWDLLAVDEGAATAVEVANKHLAIPTHQGAVLISDTLVLGPQLANGAGPDKEQIELD